MDELNAEVVTLPSSVDEKFIPLLFWNFTHPDVVFKGVDSKGILFAHLLVLRSRLGVFWTRSLQLAEITSTDGVRMFESTGPLRRYYHVSLTGYDEGRFLLYTSFFVYFSVIIRDQIQIRDSSLLIKFNVKYW